MKKEAIAWPVISAIISSVGKGLGEKRLSVDPVTKSQPLMPC